MKDGIILSKKEGAEWGIKNIDDKYQVLINEAFVCYSSDQNMIFNHSLALEYCKYMKNKIGLRE